MSTKKKNYWCNLVNDDFTQKNHLYFEGFHLKKNYWWMDINMYLHYNYNHINPLINMDLRPGGRYES